MELGIAGGCEMTRDEILRLVREVGIPDDNIPALAWGRLETGIQLLERFANAVEQAEREKCAHTVERLISGDGICADDGVWIHDCADAIRARGEK